MSRDSKIISNEEHELSRVAKKFNVELSEVLRAKEETGSSDRKVVYQWLKDNKK
jgi:hypothetical protein